MVGRRHPDRLQHLRRARNLADTDRRLDRRPDRAKNGPKLIIAFGGVFVAAPWIINSVASSLTMLYVGAALARTGGVPSTPPVSAMRSNGFPIIAGSRLG